MILAQSATRNIGVVILAVVIIGFLVYLFFNLLETRGEGGAEIELAANRKPYHSDDILETTKLDQSLLSGLFLLSVIGLALPLYWLGEPGRQEGLVENTLHLWTEDGAEAFEESCSSCHGGGGAGGIASFAITEQGTGVSRDPELSARFLGAKQDLARAQQTGINSVISDAQANLSDLQREIGETFPNAQMAAWLDEISDPSHEEYLTYGKLLFVNRADSGAYSCARCHTAGWSYEGALDLDLAGNPVTTVTDADGNEAAGYLQGGGWFGPNLTNGAEVTQFPNEDTHIDFIRKGSEDGVRYGVAGQGSGQMPGFSNRLDDDLVEIDEFGEEVSKNWPASLTEEQIAAVVAYARSL